MDPREVEIAHAIWSQYFPMDRFFVQDKRLAAVSMFSNLFRSEEGQIILRNFDPSSKLPLGFDVDVLGHLMPFPDFVDTMRTRPKEVIGCIGMAVSIVKTIDAKSYAEPFCIWPRFYNMRPETSFGDLKAGTVGQLVCITGYVIKVSACRPLIEGAGFLCGKCGQSGWSYFEDGVFNPPEMCRTEKCRNKMLELDRSNVMATDYQRVKLQECEDVADDTARVPRTFDVELRRDLINQCIPGDVVKVVGIVKAMQNEMPRGFARRGPPGSNTAGKESGIHQLFIVANSIVCVKVSGDRKATPSSVFSSSLSSSSSALPSSSSASDNNSSGVEGAVILGGGGGGGGGGGSVTSGGQGGDGGGGRASLTAFSQEDLESIREIALLGDREAAQRMHVDDSEYGGRESMNMDTSSVDNSSPQQSLACVGLLVSSLCPTIYGHELVKLGLLLSLFGGTRGGGDAGNDSAAGAAAGGGGGSGGVRPDIHCLVVGDPGLGKSQLLRAAAACAPRAVFVCGNTATNAGLTVSISREGRGNEIAIEAGALVLADQGVCCIDELDKISCDYHALLEAMEQQSVSIAKSGVVTSLKSRCSILSAANPAGGHYNRRKTVSENLKMPAALLSRFDLVFILMDKPDEAHDRMISEHIMRTHSLASSGSANSSSQVTFSAAATTAVGVGDASGASQDMTLSQRLRREMTKYSHMSVFGRDGGGHGSSSSSPSSALLSTDLLRKYIEYARTYCHPSLSKPAAKILQRIYLTMRAQASLGNSIPVTTRHLESLIRLAQARARMELREEVSESDANDVVQLLHESLLDAFTTDTGAIDLGRKGGISLAKQVKALVGALSREAKVRGNNIFSRVDISEICARLRIDKDLDSMIDVMRTECYLLLKGPRLYQLMTAS